METLTASAYPVTPQTRTSHIRTSTKSGTPQTTRRSESQHSLPPVHTSQESLGDPQSPGKPAVSHALRNGGDASRPTEYSNPASLTSAYPPRLAMPPVDPIRVRTPERQMNDPSADSDWALASPMSLASPTSTNGTKRTASGRVKNAPSPPSTPFAANFPGGRSRAESISSSSSRAGELAASLKTRLGYAMAKVQHGWEHKNIDEVERLAAHKAHVHRRSLSSHVDYPVRPMTSGLSNGTARMSMYDTYDAMQLYDGAASPPSKRHSGLFASSSQPILSTAPTLQPAADIRPSSQPRGFHTAPSSQTYTNYTTSSPHTPMNGHTRPSMLRTETQTAEAERDALQALFQLGSPHASQVSGRHHHTASQASSSQASPLRSSFATPRRVTFARGESDGSARVSESDSLPESEERV